jgi:hypothetical protein
VTYIAALLAEVRIGDPHAAEELADFVEHALGQPGLTVAAAFGLRDERLSERGERRVRDELYRDLRNFLGDGLSLRKQAEVIRLKRRRYQPRPEDRATKGERRILWELTQCDDVGERQLRRILGGR